MEDYLLKNNNLGFALHLIKAEYSINILHYKFVAVSAMYIFTFHKQKGKFMEEHLSTTLRSAYKLVPSKQRVSFKSCFMG